MTEKTISPEQVAVLAERVEQQNANHAELKGILIGISTTQGAMSTQLAILAEQLKRTEDGKARLFDITTSQDKRLDAIEADVKVHAWTWKLIGSLSMVALSMGGYVFNEFRAIAVGSGNTDKRLALLEFIVGPRSSYSSTAPQTTVNSK